MGEVTFGEQGGWEQCRGERKDLGLKVDVLSLQADVIRSAEGRKLLPALAEDGGIGSQARLGMAQSAGLP